jgi:hypothetical protein
VRIGGICKGVVYCCRFFKIFKVIRRAWDFVKAQVNLVLCPRRLSRHSGELGCGLRCCRIEEEVSG